MTKIETSDLSDRQQRIFNLIKKGEITTDKIEKNLKIPERTLRRELSELKDMGAIAERKQGNTKFWHIIT